MFGSDSNEIDQAKYPLHLRIPFHLPSITSTYETQFDIKSKLGQGFWGIVYKVRFPGRKYKGL